MLGQSFITKLLFYRNVLCEVDLKPLSLPLEAEVVQWLFFSLCNKEVRDTYLSKFPCSFVGLVFSFFFSLSHHDHFSISFLFDPLFCLILLTSSSSS